jgi:tRNA1Val (adenine37-N6)-methyltransferase
MNTKLVKLPFGKDIYQLDSGQSISSDTSFLTNTILSEIKHDKQKVLELGSGNGIISIMLSHYRPKWDILGIEIQPELMELSFQNNISAETNASFMLNDFRNFTSPDKFDLIISNPPYFKKNDGKLSPVVSRAISRHEIKCDMNDVLLTIRRNLYKNGKAFIMYPESRETEFKKNAKKVDLKIAQKFLFTGIKVIIFCVKEG